MCVAPAYAVTVCEEWHKRCCSECFEIAAGRLEICCARCDQCYYCDDRCKAAHAARHAPCCPALQRFSTLKKEGKETMAVLRLLLEVLARLHAGVEIPVDISDDACAADGRGCPSFLALQHHPPRYAALENHLDAKEASDWARCCVTFRLLVEACAWCPWKGGAQKSTTAQATSPPTDDELHALLSRIDSNCFGVYRDGHARFDAVGRNVDLLGRGVYLDACLFNHSCAPTCSATNGARCLEVVTDEAVQKGQELTIAYCDLQQPRTARQKQLRRHYNFDCACSRCTDEATPGGGGDAVKLSYSSRGGPKKAPASKRERRERREERKATGSTAVTWVGDPDSATPKTEVVVEVELRVLLKLTKAEPSEAQGVVSARRGKGGGGGGSRKAKRGQQNQPPEQQRVPVCCAFLRARLVQTGSSP